MVVMFGVLGVVSESEAQFNIPASTVHRIIRIGTISLPNPSGSGTLPYPFMCVTRMTSPSPTYVAHYLNPGSASGATLAADVGITVGDGETDVLFQSNTTLPPAAERCGLAAWVGWSPLNFGGFGMLVGLGDDFWPPSSHHYVAGPLGAPSIYVATSTNANVWAWVRSTTGTWQFQGGVDEVKLANTGSAAMSIFTGAGNDCLDFWSNAYLGTIDCSTGTDTHDLSSGAPVSCDTFFPAGNYCF